MSNPINIDAVFKPDTNLWGYHAYDCYESCEAFNWEKLPDDDLDWWYQILTHEYGYPDAFGEIIQFARENDKGITIRGTYYEWSELEPLYDKARNTNLGGGPLIPHTT